MSWFLFCICVQQDASLLATETIRVRSAAVNIQHGIYRDFPTRYKDRLGNRYVIVSKLSKCYATDSRRNPTFRTKATASGSTSEMGMGDRLNQLMPPEKTPELFDKYLPYALALDCELAWAQQFSSVLGDAKKSADLLAVLVCGEPSFPDACLSYCLWRLLFQRDRQLLYHAGLKLGNRRRRILGWRRRRWWRRRLVGSSQK
jgi:hypothetical protein